MNKVIVTGLVALALVGCGSKEEAVPAPAEAAAPAAPAADATVPTPADAVKETKLDAAGGAVIKEEGKPAVK